MGCIDEVEAGLYYQRRMATIRAKSLAFDATFAVPSKSVAAEGDLGMTKSLGTAMNECGEILDQIPIGGIKLLRMAFMVILAVARACSDPLRRGRVSMACV